MTAATASLPAILQRLHRMNDSRASHLVENTAEDEPIPLPKKLDGLEADHFRRKRNHESRIAHGQLKVASQKPISTFPVSFPADAAASSASESYVQPRFVKAAGGSRVVYFASNNDPLGSRKSKYVRITPNRYFSWNDLLNDLTMKLKRDGCYLPHGVRQIYTPVHGHRVSSLSDLLDGELYLCAGIEPFKPNQFKSAEAIQQFKEQALPAASHNQQPTHLATKSLVLPVVNTVNLAASDGSYFGQSSSRRTPAFGATPTGNVRALNASMPATLRTKFDNSNRLQRAYKKYQRLPAIKEQRELERDGNENEMDYQSTDKVKMSLNKASMESNVVKFLREELLNQAAEANASRTAAAKPQFPKRRDQPQDGPLDSATHGLAETPKPVAPFPHTERNNRLITIIYYERASSNCKIVKIMLNSPTLPPNAAGGEVDGANDDEYNRYQRLYSLKRIRKLLNKTFSKDAMLKQKLSKNSLLRLVTPSGREVTNTPDLLQILDNGKVENPVEKVPRKASVGAAMSDNNYLLIAVHDMNGDADMSELSGVNSRLNRTPISDKPDTTTISNNDLELILQELIAKNANKRLIHKLYQALHNKENQSRDAVSQRSVGKPQVETSPRRGAIKETQSEKPGEALPQAHLLSSRLSGQVQQAEADDSGAAQKSKRVKFADGVNGPIPVAPGSGPVPPPVAVPVPLAGEEAKLKPLRAKRKLSKASQPRLADEEPGKAEKKDRVDDARVQSRTRQDGTRSVDITSARKTSNKRRDSEALSSVPDTISEKTEAERRLLEAERKRRSQLITLVRRTLPPAPAFSTSAAQPAPGSTANAVATTFGTAAGVPPAAPLPPIGLPKPADSKQEEADAADSANNNNKAEEAHADEVAMANKLKIDIPSASASPGDKERPRPVSEPKKSMLSLDTPRDTQIDLKALQLVQKEDLDEDLKQKSQHDEQQFAIKDAQKAGDASGEQHTAKVEKKPESQPKSRDTPNVDTSRQSDAVDQHQSQQAAKPSAPILKATPREPVAHAAAPPANVQIATQPVNVVPVLQQQSPPQAVHLATQPHPQPQPKDKEDRKDDKRSQKAAVAGRSRYSFTKFVRGIEALQERYEFGRQLGDGNFAIVRECRSKLSAKDYAIKIIDKSKLRNKEYMLENEIRVLKTCLHPNIIELKDQYESEPNVFLVMELAKGGDLFDYITSHVKFPEGHAFEIVSDMAEAVFYLHSRNIVHRDLKPENLLICETKDGKRITKLGDFGLSMEVKKPIFTVCGTPTYVAPEILMERGYGLEVDIWALGVITYILLCGFPPFRSPERRQSELFRMIKRGDFEFISPYWDHVSASAKDFIRHLLVVEPSRRYKAVDVLTHPWILTKGNTKRLDRYGLAELQERTRGELEQKALVLLRDYRETLAQLDQQYSKLNGQTTRPGA